ncbi:LysR family transcriptional regulator ArgP [Arthrobacter sp. NPDC055138]
MQPFQFVHLATFAVVVQEGSFDAASRALQVTPSAVSQRIKAMEQAAGQVLLQRTSPVQPTAAGDVVLRLARQVRVLQADAQRELGGSVTRTALPLVVNADSLATWFLGALARMPRDRGVFFEVHREDEQHSTSLLRSGRVTAAVTATPEPVQGCSVEALGSLRYRAVASSEYLDHWRPDGTPDGGLAWLAAAPVLDFDRKDDLQERFYRTLTGEDLAAPRHYMPASGEFAAAVRLGIGWALLPEQQCLADLRRGTLRQLAPELPVDVPLYWQRWKISSPILDELSACVRQTAEEELRQP